MQQIPRNIHFRMWIQACSWIRICGSFTVGNCSVSVSIAVIASQSDVKSMQYCPRLTLVVGCVMCQGGGGRRWSISVGIMAAKTPAINPGQPPPIRRDFCDVPLELISRFNPSPPSTHTSRVGLIGLT